MSAKEAGPCMGKDEAFLRKVGGEESVKTAMVCNQAVEEGRYGYAALEFLKANFHDIPVHQFSSGDTAPKPAATPAVKTPDSHAKGK
jgi:hypothetical protein